jgi:hypothetical protein
MPVKFPDDDQATDPTGNHQQEAAKLPSRSFAPKWALCFFQVKLTPFILTTEPFFQY